MGSACQDCRRTSTRDRPAVQSLTGRRICADCDGGIDTHGWFQRAQG